MCDPPHSSSAKRISLQPVKYSSRTTKVSKLRSLHKSAVTAFDIDGAELLGKQIAALSDKNFASSYHDLKCQLGDSVRGLLAQHSANLQAINSREASDLANFKRHINIEFMAMRNAHERELIDLQHRFATRRLEESSRKISDAVELMQQSQYAATIHDYEQARLLRGFAEQAVEKEIQRRNDRINTDLHAQTSLTIEGCQKQIEVLVRRFTNGIAEIQSAAATKRQAECEMRDVKIVGELTRISKDFCHLAPTGTDHEPYLRELEDVLVGIIEAAGLPLPRKITKRPHVVSRRSNFSPRKA
jgi:hypothetical protein